MVAQEEIAETPVMETHRKPSTASWRDVVEKSYCDDCLWYAQYINQYLAMPPTYVFWRLGISPNGVSAISFLITCLAVFLMCTTVPTGLAGSAVIYLLLSFGYVLDSSDGQLARVAGMGSKFGYFLDHFLDGVKILLVNSALGWVLVRASATEGGFSLAAAYGAFAVALFGQGVFFVAFNFKTFIYKPKLVASNLPNTEESRKHLLLLQPTDFGLFTLLALFCHVPEMLLKVYWAFGAYHAVVTLAYVFVSLRVMRRIEET